MTAPESLTYGRHAVSATNQRVRDAGYAVDTWLIGHLRAVEVVIVLLGLLTATVIGLAATGLPMTAMAVGLVGGLAVALGISMAATGGEKP